MFFGVSKWKSNICQEVVVGGILKACNPVSFFVWSLKAERPTV